MAILPHSPHGARRKSLPGPDGAVCFDVGFISISVGESVLSRIRLWLWAVFRSVTSDSYYGHEACKQDDFSFCHACGITPYQGTL